MKQYRIEWKIIHNNYKGKGEWNNSKKIIESWVTYLNKEYSGEIKHWVVINESND